MDDTAPVAAVDAPGVPPATETPPAPPKTAKPPRPQGPRLPKGPRPEVISVTPINGTPRGGGGGPRVNTRTAAGTLTQENPDGKPQPLPRPPKYDCSAEPKLFFRYHAKLKAEGHGDRLVVYVYRNWPVWDPGALLTPEEREKVFRKEMRLSTNIAKLLEPLDADAWEQEIYHRFGSGDYHFKLNDVPLKRTICMTNVRGLRDFDSYPPVVDPATVIVSDPANASYLERMRLKGVRFPGDPGYTAQTPDGEDMAAAQADTITKLTDTVISMARDNKPQAQTPAPDPRAKAEVAAVETVAAGAREAISIMAESLKSQQTTQAQASDPRAYFRDILELATALRGPAQAPAPPPVDPMVAAAPILAMMEKQMALQQQMFTLQLEELKSRLGAAERSAEQARQSAVAAVQTQVQTLQHQQQNPGGTGGPQVNHREPDLLTQLDKLITLKDRLSGLGEAGGPVGDDVPGWVPFLVRGVEAVAGAAQNVFYNIAAAKNGSGAIPPPQPGEQVEAPGALPGAPPQPAGVPQMDLTGFAQRLHGPLVKALNEGIPGYEFGARMLLHEGAMAYGYLAGQTLDQLYALMQRYPPMWADVLRFGAQRVDQFMLEFLDQEEVAAVAQEMQSGQMPQPGRPKKTGQPRGQAHTAPPTGHPGHQAAAPGAGPGPRVVQTASGPVEVLPPQGVPPQPQPAAQRRGPKVNPPEGGPPAA